MSRFIQMTSLRQPSSTGGVVFMGDFATPMAPTNDIIAAAQIVEKILDRVLPRWRTEVPDDGKKRWARHRQAAIRAEAELERQEEVAERLGDNAPTISAGEMHPGPGRRPALFGSPVIFARRSGPPQSRSTLRRRTRSLVAIWQKQICSNRRTATMTRNPASPASGQRVTTVAKQHVPCDEGLLLTQRDASLRSVIQLAMTLWRRHPNRPSWSSWQL